MVRKPLQNANQDLYQILKHTTKLEEKLIFPLLVKSTHNYVKIDTINSVNIKLNTTPNCLLDPEGFDITYNITCLTLQFHFSVHQCWVPKSYSTSIATIKKFRKFYVLEVSL